MEIIRLALLCFSVLALSACGESDRVYKEHCKAPPANWSTKADHNSRLEGSGVIDPIYNVIDLDRAGSFSWNGYAISKMELVKYVHQTDSLDPAPMIIMRIDDLTPCRYVEDFRKIMMKSTTCQRPEKLCTEDNPELEPPPEEKTEAEQSHPRD
jgi:hypothetical protein